MFLMAFMNGHELSQESWHVNISSQSKHPDKYSRYKDR